MTTFFLKSGKCFTVTNEEELNIIPALPPGTYTVGCAGEFFLQKINSFTIEHKLYGNTNQDAKRILQTFLDRKHSTGVLLSGEKGSGKTLLAKRISMLAEEGEDIPTIVINSRSYVTEDCEKFFSFIQAIQQPTIILLDEFEKVFPTPPEQNLLLTLLDGVYESKKLFVLTCNTRSAITSHMMNRPGRLFYALDFDGIYDEDFVRDYCRDNLKEKEHIELVCSVTKVFTPKLNFDMLQAIVEEMNRYGESPAQVLRYVNAHPRHLPEDKFTVTLRDKGSKLLDVGKAQNPTWRGNPFNDVITIYHSEKYECEVFTARDIIGFDGNGTTTLDLDKNQAKGVSKKGNKGKASPIVALEFENANGAHLTLTTKTDKAGVNFETLQYAFLRKSSVSKGSNSIVKKMKKAKKRFWTSRAEKLSETEAFDTNADQ